MTNNLVSVTQVDSTSSADLVSIVDQILNMPAAVALLAFLIVIGRIIKTWPNIDNKWIPVSLCTIGSIAYCTLTSWKALMFMQGFLLGAAAVGVNQLWRQHQHDLAKALDNQK